MFAHRSLLSAPLIATLLLACEPEEGGEPAATAAEAQALSERLDAVEASLAAQANLPAELSAAQADISSLQADVDALSARLEAVEAEQAALDSRLLVVEGALVALQDALAAGLGTLEAEVAGLWVELEATGVEVDELKAVAEVDGARVSALEAFTVAQATLDAGQDSALAAVEVRTAALEGAGYATEAWVTDQAYLTASSPELDNLFALDGYVTVDETSNIVRFTGANVQIVNGNGHTFVYPNGLGNLIIGYNEYTGSESRTGSHNLVVGAPHSFTSMAGVVFGAYNKVSGTGATVLGGNSSTSSGTQSVVVGGVANTSAGSYSVVVGKSYQSTSTAFGVTGY